MCAKNLLENKPVEVVNNNKESYDRQTAKKAWLQGVIVPGNNFLNHDCVILFPGNYRSFYPFCKWHAAGAAWLNRKDACIIHVWLAGDMHAGSLPRLFIRQT